MHSVSLLMNYPLIKSKNWVCLWWKNTFTFIVGYERNYKVLVFSSNELHHIGTNFFFNINILIYGYQNKCSILQE
jgi:hypothetical protein